MISTVALALFALLVFGCNATDYCNKALCPDGVAHIGCNNTNKFAARCDNSVLLINGFDDMMLDYHNTVRHEVASGASDLLPAVRMRILTWNKELAELAEYNVRQCMMKYDDCLNTDEFRATSQNVGYLDNRNFTYAGFGDAIKQILGTWFAEIKLTHQAWIDKYKNNTNTNTVSHFIKMIQDQATEVGCRAIVYDIKSSVRHSVTCNYNFRNIVNRPIYVSGAAASKCKTKTHHYYTSLCTCKSCCKNKKTCKNCRNNKS